MSLPSYRATRGAASREGREQHLERPEGAGELTSVAVGDWRPVPAVGGQPAPSPGSAGTVGVLWQLCGTDEKGQLNCDVFLCLCVLWVALKMTIVGMYL